MNKPKANKISKKDFLKLKEDEYISLDDALKQFPNGTKHGKMVIM